MLKEIAPSVTRAAVLRDPPRSPDRPIRCAPSGGAGAGYGAEPVGVRDRCEIERAIAAFRARPNGGLIVTASARRLQFTAS